MTYNDCLKLCFVYLMKWLYDYALKKYMTQSHGGCIFKTVIEHSKQLSLFGGGKNLVRMQNFEILVALLAYSFEAFPYKITI